MSPYNYVTTALMRAKQYFCKTLWLMMMHHHTMSGYNGLNSSKDTVSTKCSMKFSTFVVTLNLNTVKQCFHKTVYPMTYHQKSGSKRISSSAIPSLVTKGSAVQPYQVWLQKVQQFSHTKSGYKRFSSSEDIQTTINEILNIYYDLDLTATQ